MILDLTMDSQIPYQKNQQQKKKQRNWTSSKLKTFVLPRTLSRKSKDNPQDWKKIPANRISNKGLVYRTCKEILQLNNKKLNNPFFLNEKRT